jgi:hypothetical protein
MSDLLKEQLSALIDGELPAAETALLLKRLGQEAELRECLARYRVCGESLRGARIRTRADFTLRVTAVLAAEPCHSAARGSAPQRRTLRRYLMPAAGFAVAAAVAGVAILVLGRPPALDGRPTELVAAVAPQPSIVTPPVALASPRRSAEAIPAAARGVPFSAAEPASYVTPQLRQGLGVIPRAELANYVVAHSEVSGPLGLHSVLTNLVSDEQYAPAGTPTR